MRIAAVGRALVVALAAACVAAASPGVAHAQAWNDARSLDLARQATARRAAQIADTALADYQASAHGYLTFLGQFGEGFPDPPAVVKTDELALDVYWKAPNLSKQRIVGRRDTLLLPADVGYYRDRYGIIQNNFPDRIRLGDGNDVRDVPHPLSAAGLADYDFAVGDSIRIRLADRAISVYELRVRPRDDRQPRVVGSVYVSSDDYSVARMTLTFTQAAILDRRIETLAVTLENALVAGRFWLPRRQELEVVRGGTWLDYPARGIIRGRWDISGYRTNIGLPASYFRGAEIVQAPPSEMSAHVWQGRVTDSLPADVRALTPAEVASARQQAEDLIRQRALARAGGAAAVSARRLSDFARVNRAEGLALGAGAALRPTPALTLTVRGRYGIDDQRAKGRAVLGLAAPGAPTASLFAEREYRDAADVQERSLAVNSVAAGEFGSDATEPYEVRAAGIASAIPAPFGIRLQGEAAAESHRAVRLRSSPANGRYEPTLNALPLHGVRASISADRALGELPFGARGRVAGELRGLAYRRDDDLEIDPKRRALGRVWLSADVERPRGDARLVLRTLAGAVDAEGAVPPQELLLLGGPVSAPSFDYHQIRAQVAVAQRVEWQAPVPFPSLSLGRYGRSPARATLAPFASAVYARHVANGGREGFFPSLGVGGLFLFDLVRLDVARGLRDGRWTFSADVTRTLWPIL